MGPIRAMPSCLSYAILPLALVPGAALAAEQGGMPQLDQSTFASQIFWLAIFFVVVFVFLRFVGLPRVTAILAERGLKVGGDLTEAERLRAQSDETLKAYEAVLAAAHGKARKLLAETHEKNAATLTERTRAATAEFDQRVGEAVKRIDAAQADALKGIREVATGLVAELATKVAGRAPAPASVTRAIDAAGTA